MSTARYMSPELWLVVFKHMSCTPLAHQKHVEKASPNFQPTLAACARVCRTFHELAAPYLYVYPVVNSLPLFIAEVDTPSLVPGLKSKAELLAGTEHLFLEYSAKPLDDGPVTDEEVNEYAETLEYPGGDIERLKEEIHWLRDADRFSRALRTIIDEPYTPSRVFPILKTLSTGAATARRDMVDAGRSGMWGSLHYIIRDALYEFLTKATSVRHFCSTHPGLLSLEARTYFSLTNRDLSITTHSGIDQPQLTPVCLGLRTSWIVNSDSHMRDICIPDPVVRGARTTLVNLFEERRLMALGEDADAVPSWSVKGGLYIELPETEEGSEHLERDREEIRQWAQAETKKIMEEVVAYGKEGLPQAIKVDDSFEIVPLFDGECAACGWRGSNVVMRRGRKEAMDEYDKAMSTGPSRAPKKFKRAKK